VFLKIRRKLMAKLKIIFLCATLSLSAGIVFAAPLGTAFTYQGHVQLSGVNISDTADLQFSLWDAAGAGSPPAGGTQIGTTQTVSNIQVVGGYFTIQVDFGANVFNGDARWLEIAVASPSGGAFTTLAPRQPVTATPNALFALNASGLSLPQAGSADVPSPNAVFKLTNTNPINGSALWCETSGTNGIGVYSNNTATTGFAYAGLFQSASPDGRAVFGSNSATTGAAFGGRFGSASTSGTAVYATASSPTGNTNGGVFESVSSTGGIGVYGHATHFGASNTTYGVYGQSDSGGFAGGIGVFGYASATFNTNYGVYGQSNSPSGFDFFAGGAGVNYGAASSMRWKSDIEPIGQPLDKLGRLRGVYFNWDTEHGGQHDVGMIAEEVGTVLPEIVIYEENGVDAIGMDYSKMTPLLVEAVNSLRAEKDAELAALRAEKDTQLSEQQERINVLITRLEWLEKMMSQTGQTRKDTD
jgi:hypothetical protein